MNIELARAFALSLPCVVETMQWGDNLVFWVGDKAIGGKMFTLIDLVGSASKYVISYSAGPERYAELLEKEGLSPAPYMARIHWIAAEHWRVFRDAQWHEQLTVAHNITLNKLPPRTRAILALPAREQKKLIAERQKLLATRSAAKKKNTT
jgi:predicted DNA-binding protein (MmcQ/YjbR family)